MVGYEGANGLAMQSPGNLKPGNVGRALGKLANKLNVEVQRPRAYTPKQLAHQGRLLTGRASRVTPSPHRSIDDYPCVCRPPSGMPSCEGRRGCLRAATVKKQANSEKLFPPISL
jgi:hypothetical protein